MEGTVIFHSAHPLVALRYKDGPPRAVSWGGMSFQPDQRGVNMVPVEAVRELTESHGMEGVPEHAMAPTGAEQSVQRAVAELGSEEVSQAPPRRDRRRVETAPGQYARLPQTSDGGAVRPAVFPPGGDHPDGGLQPALTETPDENALKAAQSQTPHEA